MDKPKPRIEWMQNAAGSGDPARSRELFPAEKARLARKFHQQIPGYRMTPLRSLPHLADMAELGGIWVKDEAVRLALNSFKVLGGSFAIYRFLQERLGLSGQPLSFEYLTSPEVMGKLGTITFASATDGNHGRGVAWAAQQLGHRSMIYVHAQTSKPRIEAIRGFGATVKVVEGNYDDAVRQVAADARANGWEVISDTSWEGYSTVPRWIMQGYTTMFSEAQEQFAAQGIIRPSHIFIQAGVGALAAAIIGYYHSLFGEDAPVCVVVEPDRAACLYASAVSADRKPHTVSGDLDTIMAGLACGEPSPLAWEVLRECADFFLTCPDYIAAKGMRIYATPLAGDPFIVSGESGAVTLGALFTIMKGRGYEPLAEALRLDRDSQVLLVNTEGNTDPVHFRRVIWEGADPVPRECWTDDWPGLG